MMDNYGSHYPGGDYILLYEGEGKFRFEGQTAQITQDTPGRMVVNVIPKNGIVLSITETNPNNPLRNIHFIMLGFEKTYQTQPFHPLFLERLRPFPVLRFMNWMLRFSQPPVKTWEERTKLTSATQMNDNGAAPEYIIALAIALNAHPWLTISHLASDDYVHQLATLFHDHLDPALNVYLEFSNEAWNGVYPQSAYVQEQWIALNLASDRNTAGLRFYSQRALQVFKLWEAVFDDPTRLVRILAGQATNPYANQQVLNWQDAFKSIDAFAIAPYFGAPLLSKDMIQKTAAMTVDQLFDALKTLIHDTATNSLAWLIAQAAALTQQHRLPLIAYEGGQHLWALGDAQNDTALTTLFTTANRDARMKSIYLDYLAMWTQQGGGLFMNFDYVSPYGGRNGNFGALEFQDQDPSTAAKYQALLEYLATAS
jgi:hypothetical protein